MTIFNKTKVNYLSQPMFFGESLNVQRFDQQTIPAFETLTKRQLSYFWTPEEIELQRDRSDFKNLNDVQKHIFTSNLKYQILLDSIQGRAPVTAFLPIVSLPELETCITWWGAFETIHSRTYTYMIKNVYANPSEILDDILEIKEIISRASSIGKYYDEFIDLTKTTKNIHVNETYDVYKKLYLALVSVYILEAIRFYVSFACTFAFGELKCMEGSAKLLTFIARDENLHMSITQHILNIIHNSPQDAVPYPNVMKKVVADSSPIVYDMFYAAIKEEKEWADYLFKDGSMIGLNAKLLHDYVEWLSNKRAQNIGLPKLFDRSTLDSANPLPWTKNWLSSRGEQVAPQETEISSYLIGSLNKNIETDLTGFEL